MKYMEPKDVPALEGTELGRRNAPSLRVLVRLAQQCDSAEQLGKKLPALPAAIRRCDKDCDDFPARPADGDKSCAGVLPCDGSQRATQRRCTDRAGAGPDERPG